MYTTLICACHNVSHPNLKGLLSHLRALRIWFPVFTCYHCMITFTDRSASTKHYLRCPRSNLETLIKLSNLKKRSEVKTRLYQVYKCNDCRFLYSFHEDYCKHVDEEHSQITLPLICTCGRQFHNNEDYKDHVYVSCLVDFYCDICFITVKTLAAFKKHAIEVHDASEGFVLRQDDNYKQRRSLPMREVKIPSVKREYTDEKNIISGKRRTSYKPIIDDDEEKVLNPLSIKYPGTECPICEREYSTNNNMLRHYRTHFNDDGSLKNEQVVDNSIYCCPDCGGMFNSEEWELHKEMHKKKKCAECNKTFQFQSELEQHRSTHLNLKLYRDSKTQNYKSTMASPNSETNNIVMMCEVCDRMFTSKEKLKEHKLTHDKKVMPVLKPKNSDDEEKANKFEIRNSWNENKKRQISKVDQFPKRCQHCPKLFNTNGSYTNHMQMHERTAATAKSRIVPARESTRIRTPVLKQEIKDEDSDGESYQTCKRCFKVFSSKSTLRNHMKSHGINTSPPNKPKKHNSKKVWCDICHCAFENLAHLKRHKAEDHDETMPNLIPEEDQDLKSPFVFTCDICVQTFTSKMALKKHKERHENEVKPVARRQVSVYCKYCKIPFVNPHQLSIHMKEEHMEGTLEKPTPKEKPREFKCKICGKVFNTFSALNTHQGWHKRVRPENSTVIDTKIEITSIKEEPLEPKAFKCSKCSVVCPNDTALQIHILEKHRNINATVMMSRCSMCNLDFSSLEEYDQHKRFHAMVEKQPKKTYSCSQCPATFSKNDVLKTHIRQFHSKPQGFKCQYCDRVFDKPNSLGIHLKVHEKQKLITGNVSSRGTPPPPAPTQLAPKKFTCSICNKGFDIPKELRTHTMQAHPF